MMDEIITNFKENIKRLHNFLQKLGYGHSSKFKQNNLSRTKGNPKINNSYIERQLKNLIKEFTNSAWSLVNLRKISPDNDKLILSILAELNELITHYERGEYSSMLYSLEDIADYSIHLTSFSQSKNMSHNVNDTLQFNIPNFPSSISSELIADIEELKRCYNAGCYRSSIILCGRLLEVSLHRKYYEITGNDLLETSPGIGLGTIIAKLDNKLTFDPGIKDQIHLINKVRISSVHKQSIPFNPTKDQTLAVILYTMDVLNRLFQ